jgi:hypothetical protein
MEAYIFTLDLFLIMKKAAPFILLLLMAIAVILIKRCKNNQTPESKTTINSNSNRTPSAKIDRNRGFDRRISYLEYSNHVRCRMDCRHITQAEVQEIMQQGKINYSKSNLQNARCPRYALEGITQDNQKTRIIFAQCNEKTEVVTVIDLDTEWSCNCPGDDVGSTSSPHKNRN